MVTINCTVYEKHDLLKVLDYAKEKRIEDCDKGKITTEHLELDLKTIETLKLRVHGKYREDYQDVSSKSYREQCNARKDEIDPQKEYEKTFTF